MKLKFFVLGNCQASPLRKILISSNNFSEKFEIIESDPKLSAVYLLASDEESQKRLFQIIENINLFIYQNNGVSYGEKLSTDFLLKMLKPNCLKLSLPNSYYKGYNPETIYLKHNRILVNRFCDYHDSNVIRDYLLGKSESDVVSSILDIEYYSNDFIWENSKNSLSELRKREMMTDIIISDFIEENWTKIKLFHSMNHPTNFVLLEVADRILTYLGLPKLNIEERNSHYKEYFDNIHVVIYKSFSKILSFEFPEKYKLGNGYLSIKDYVHLVFQVYEELGLDILKNNLEMIG